MLLQSKYILLNYQNSFRIIANVLQLPKGGDFEVPHVRDQPSRNFDRSTIPIAIGII